MLNLLSHIPPSILNNLAIRIDDKNNSMTIEFKDPKITPESGQNDNLEQEVKEKSLNDKDVGSLTSIIPVGKDPVPKRKNTNEDPKEKRPKHTQDSSSTTQMDPQNTSVSPKMMELNMSIFAPDIHVALLENVYPIPETRPYSFEIKIRADKQFILDKIRNNYFYYKIIGDPAFDLSTLKQLSVKVTIEYEDNNNFDISPCISEGKCEKDYIILKMMNSFEIKKFIQQSFQKEKKMTMSGVALHVYFIHPLIKTFKTEKLRVTSRFRYQDPKKKN
jgi:hypothetical protein